MKRAVSISLGSSKRDKRVETTLLGQSIVLERIGTDGDQKKMRRLFQEMDGQVDAFGFGGADLSLEVDGRDYPLYSVAKLVDGVKTAVVDGGGVRAVVERQTARQLAKLLPNIQPKRALFCVGVGRYHMARGFLDEGYEVRFGDLAFGLDVPIFLHSLTALHRVARILLPVMGRVPFEWLYPTGDKQNEIKPKYHDQFAWASVVADDFLYVKKNLPERMDGKIVVTNTTTPEDIELLRARGVSHLVTSTPRLDGRSFGTNMMEAALVALSGKKRPLSNYEIAEMLGEADMLPTVLALS